VTASGRRDEHGFSIHQWTLLIAILAVLVYVHTVRHGFVFDDSVEVVENAFVHGLANVPEIFTGNAWAGAGYDASLYRPLTTTSLALNHALTGLEPWSFHLVNVLLHALVSLAILRIGLRWGLGTPAAAITALVFALHPVHVEVVANVAGRKELLVTLFLLVMVLAHDRAADRRGWLAVAALSYLAALLCKETGAVGIALVVICDVLARGWRDVLGRRRLSLHAVYLVVFLGYLIIRWQVLGTVVVEGIPELDNPAAHASPGVRLLTAVSVLGRGLLLLVAPVSLSPDYSLGAIPLVHSPWNVQVVATVVFIVGVTILAWRIRHRAPLPLFALGWYAIALAPAANILTPIGTTFGERLLYLPSIAFCLLAGHVLTRVVPTKARAVLIVAVLAALGLRTAVYAEVWSDEVALFTHAVSAVPGSARAHYMLGRALEQEGREVEARAAYQRALAIYPAYSVAGSNLAALHARLGDEKGARELYRKALDDQPQNPDAVHGLATMNRERAAATAMARAAGHDGRTVAEIFAQRDELKGRPVAVRGRVTKCNVGIMGRNWIHLQDGTEHAGSFDLTVTTTATADVGDVVLVRGTVGVDRSFGVGYRYPVIVEDAIVEKTRGP